MFKWFCSIWNKLKWLIGFVYKYVKPIYKDVSRIIKEVRAEGFKDEDARRETSKRINLVLKSIGLNYPDSVVNLIIEVVYQLTKRGKA